MKCRILPDGQDTFAEVDLWVNYRMEETAQNLVIRAFGRHDITLHIDDGCMGGGGAIGHDDYIDNTESSNIKSTYFENENPGRVGIFHWCLFAHRNDPSDEPGYGSTGDLGESEGIDGLIVFDDANEAYAKRKFKSHSLTSGCTFMHELGHSLGIDRDYLGFSVPLSEYPSCMNYNSVDLIDYSDGTHGSNDFNDWGELDLTYFNT